MGNQDLFLGTTVVVREYLLISRITEFQNFI
jgi:hypothetical protein